MKAIFYPAIILTALVLSCTKPAAKTEAAQTQEGTAAQGVKSTVRYDGIGLRLHTMIEWTDDAHDLWRRVSFGCYNDIIIEVGDKTNIDEVGHYQGILFDHAKETFITEAVHYQSVLLDYAKDVYIKLGDETIFKNAGKYQYILFDYVKKEVTDIITINDSSSPLLFYKSRLPNILLLENNDGTQRYKYIYGEGVSKIEDAEFMSLVNGLYFSESPYSEAYLIRYTRHTVESPPVVYYLIDKSHLPEALPDNLNVDDELLDKLNARLFNSDPHITRAADWKIWDKKYVFMLNSDENSNPYGHRAYYAVRTLDNKLVFTIPQIMVPALKYESNPLYSFHDTLIDFNADQKRVLIKGMYNDKLCVMIYDIVTYEEWREMGNSHAEHLTLGADLTSPLKISKRIDAEQYSVEPGTTTMYGVLGNIVSDIDLCEEPGKNSNVIMRLDDETMDRYKHREKDGIFSWEMGAFEILNCKETKANANNTKDYWYQIRFDSAVNWQSTNNNDVYDYRIAKFDVYSEYTGWVRGKDIKLRDPLNENIIIHSRPLE